MSDLLKNNDEEHAINTEFNGLVYTLFTVDQWLSKNSYDLQGVFSSKSKAVKYAKAEQLLDPKGENHILIYEGQLDHFDEGLKEVLNTQSEKDRMLLVPS